MQYGAVDTRNLATDLTRPNYNDIGIKTYRGNVKPDGIHDTTPTTVNKIGVPLTTFNDRLTGETPKGDGNNWLYLQGIFEELYNDTKKVQEKSRTRGSTTSPNNGNPDEGRIKREKISHQASNELKSQTKAVQTLCYDTTRTINVLQALQNIDREGSWYHTTAEQAKAIFRPRANSTRYRRLAGHHALKERRVEKHRRSVGRDENTYI